MLEKTRPPHPPALWQFIPAVLVMFTPLVHADSIFGVTSDTDVRADSTVIASNNTSLQPGGSGSPALDRSSVFVFQLPDFGAVANPFTSAVLRFHLSSKTGTPQNMDLYDLGRRSGSTVLASDYYGQITTVDAPDRWNPLPEQRATIARFRIPDLRHGRGARRNGRLIPPSSDFPFFHRG